MKRNLFVLFVVLLSLATACNAQGFNQGTGYVIATSPAPGGNSLQLVSPLAPGNLPKDLADSLSYQQPPVDCANANDPNQTCSTREGQATNGDFTLKAQTAIVMTGDTIIISQNGNELVGRLNVSVHDLWVVANMSSSDLSLHMNAPNGSFRGYFTSNSGELTMAQITHLRDLHIEHFLKPPQPRKYVPTPVVNCGDFNGCPNTNVRVVVWNGSTWQANVGFYEVGTTNYWTS